MKPYISLFKEAPLRRKNKNKNPLSIYQRIVDISNLTWDIQTKLMTKREAIRNCPSGWRLPTIEELYTACKENTFNGEDKSYISSNDYQGYYYLAMNFLHNQVTYYSNTIDINVCYVKDKN